MNTSTTVVAKKRPNRQILSAARLTTLTQAAERAAERGTVRMRQASQDTQAKD